MKVHNIKNSNPRTFSNVKVFAGDNFYPAAAASYKNLVWESSWGNYEDLYFIYPWQSISFLVLFILYKDISFNLSKNISDRCPVVACPRLVVRGATYGSNDGEYKLVSQKVQSTEYSLFSTKVQSTE